MGKKWNKIKLGITAECIMMINLFKDGKKINFMNGDGEKALRKIIFVKCGKFI